MVKKYVWLILFIAFVSLIVIYFKEAINLFKFILQALHPIFIALFFALIFNIPTTFFETKVFKFKKKKLIRPIAIATTYILLTAITVLFLYFLVPQLIESVKVFSQNFASYNNNLDKFLNNIFVRFGLSESHAKKVVFEIKEEINKLLQNISGFLPQVIIVVKKITNGFIIFFFAIVLSIYMLADKNRLLNQLWRFIYSITPYKVSLWIKNTAKISSTIFSKFLGGQVFEAILLGVLNFFGMLILRLPYPLLVSAIVLLSNIIPMLGAYIGGIAGFIIVAFVSIKSAVIYIIFMILLQQFENNVTYPKVVGNSLGLSGFWILSSALIGGALFGFWGIMLGVPAVAVVYKMLGFTLKKNPEASSLMPEILKQSTKEAGNNNADHRRE